MGQGVTKAAMEATTLNALLSNAAASTDASQAEKKRGALPATFSKSFFEVQSRRLEDIW